MVCYLLQSGSVPPLVLGKATVSLHQALFKGERFSLGLSIHVNRAGTNPRVSLSNLVAQLSLTLSRILRIRPHFLFKSVFFFFF